MENKAEKLDFLGEISIIKSKIKEINEASEQTQALVNKLNIYLNDRKKELHREQTEIHEQQLVLDNILYDLNTSHLNRDTFGRSTILTLSDKQTLIQLCNFPLNTKWNLIYRASVDGFSAKMFHEKCNGVKETLSVIKTTDGYIFGGFTGEKWNQANNYVHDKNAFIFSLINQRNTPIMLKTNVSEHSIYSHPSYGPTFGSGHDIFISDNSNSNSLSHSILCHTYQHPDFSYNSDDAKKFLAGNDKFKVAEIEVFHKA